MAKRPSVPPRSGKGGAGVEAGGFALLRWTLRSITVGALSPGSVLPFAQATAPPWASDFSRSLRFSPI